MNIQEKIDTYIQNKEKKDRPFSGKVTASGLGHCFRKQYWRINREEPSNPLDQRVLRVFEAGNLFHDFVQGIIKEEIPGTEIEVKYEDDVVSIRADMVSSDTVFEIKSMHSNAFHWIRKKQEKDIPIGEQKYENIIQAICGAYFLGKDWVHLIFVSKDDLCIYEIRIPVWEEWVNPMLGEVATTKLYLLDGVLPPAEPRLWGVNKRTNKPVECDRCEFKDKCFKEQKNGAT